MIRLLIEKGAAVDAIEEYGSTPMRRATAEHSLDVARLLIGMVGPDRSACSRAMSYAWFTNLKLNWGILSFKTSIGLANDY